ncbi:MAG: hypothetical protein IT469_01730 [Pseudomonadales bacterium]|nr:hypothetical protein [Pseudomonadales bacterium]
MNGPATPTPPPAQPKPADPAAKASRKQAAEQAQADAAKKQADQDALDRKALEMVLAKPGDAAGGEHAADSSSAAGGDRMDAVAASDSSASDSSAGDSSAGDEDARARESLVNARHALRRDGYGDETLKTLTDAQIIALGSARKAHQDAQQRAYEARRKGKPAADPDTKPGAKGRKTEGAADGHADPEDQAADDADPADDAAAEGIDDALDLLEPDDRKRVASRIEAQAATVREASDRLLAANLELAAIRLAREYPQLTSQDVLLSVVKKMDELDKGARRARAGGLDSTLAIMRDAAFIVAGKSTPARAQAPRAAGGASAATPDVDDPDDLLADQPLTADRRPRGDAELNQDDRDRIAFEAITSTRTPQEAVMKFARATTAGRGHR